MPPKVRLRREPCVFWPLYRLCLPRVFHVQSGATRAGVSVSFFFDNLVLINKEVKPIPSDAAGEFVAVRRNINQAISNWLKAYNYPFVAEYGPSLTSDGSFSEEHVCGSEDKNAFLG